MGSEVLLSLTTLFITDGEREGSKTFIAHPFLCGFLYYSCNVIDSKVFKMKMLFQQGCSIKCDCTSDLLIHYMACMTFEMSGYLNFLILEIIKGSIYVVISMYTLTTSTSISSLPFYITTLLSRIPVMVSVLVRLDIE